MSEIAEGLLAGLVRAAENTPPDDYVEVSPSDLMQLINAARESAKLARRVGEPEAAPSDAGSLECDHCGDDAIYSGTGEFSDGDGGKCEQCGFPGHVSADGEVAYWLSSDDPDDRCNLRDCSECLHADEPELSAMKARAEAAEVESARLRKLFDDAGQGEHNVLALEMLRAYISQNRERDAKLAGAIHAVDDAVATLAAVEAKRDALLAALVRMRDELAEVSPVFSDGNRVGRNWLADLDAAIKGAESAQ